MEPSEREPSSGPPVLPTLTNTDLLEGLKDPANQALWRAYVERYRPMIVLYARRLGIREADAEDVAQASLLEFTKSYREGKYDREQGRLRSWLFGIVSHEVSRWRRRSARRADRREDAEVAERALSELQAPDVMERLWEQEWSAAILREALSAVRGELSDATLRAFELFALDRRPAAEVAAELGISQNAVFKAKRRVLRRVQDVLPLMERIW